jgi:hypothetical protein
MTGLSPDYHQKSKLLFQSLLRGDLRPPEAKGALDELADQGRDAAESIPRPSPCERIDEECASPAPGAVVYDEKLVKLTDVSLGRKAGLKTLAPSTLDLLEDEADLPKLSLDALKKLAKASSVDIPKQGNKAAILSVLLDAYRTRKSLPSPYTKDVCYSEAAEGYR